jgi:hypothetical protein
MNFLDAILPTEDEAIAMLCVAHVPRDVAVKYVDGIPRNAQRPSALRSIASKPFTYAAEARKLMSPVEAASFDGASARADSPQWWHAGGGKRGVDLLPIDDDEDVIMHEPPSGVLSPTPLRIAFLEDRIDRLERQVMLLKAQEAKRAPVSAWEMPASVLLAAANPDATPASIYSSLKRT